MTEDARPEAPPIRTRSRVIRLGRMPSGGGRARLGRLLPGGLAPRLGRLLPGGLAPRFGLSTVVAVGALAALAVAWVALPPAEARAAGPAKQPTALVLELPAAVDMGAHPTARVRLTSGGNPVPGQLVSLRLGAQITRQVTTGRDGSAATEIVRDLSAGSYVVTATFAGTPTYQSSQSRGVALTVRPLRLTIATVPATPGLRLVRVGNGPPLTTGADGTVAATVDTVGDLALRLALPADASARHVVLAQWDDGSNDAVRTIRIPDTLRVEIGLQFLYPVSLELSASDDSPIGISEVANVRISDSTGQEQALAGAGPHWLPANAVIRPGNRLITAPVQYRVVEVPLDGVNVVNRGQQQFVVDGPLTLRIKLLVFNLQIQGRDALLKSPSGSRATITVTGGTARIVQLDSEARATIRLPRGEYHVVLGGSLGVALSTPVALSRDQTVEPLVLTVLDIVLFAGVLFGIAVGLVLVGRPRLLPLRRLRASGPDGETGGGGGGPPGDGGGTGGGGASRRGGPGRPRDAGPPTSAPPPGIPPAPPEARTDLSGVPFPRRKEP